ncbi:MAG: hypothetical protein WC346_05870 [Methanogenium sp.]|jgi:uncharacterized membrane protein
MKAEKTILLFAIVIAFAYILGIITRPIPEQKAMTYEDSVWEAQYSQYEADLAKDTTICIIGGQVCKKVPNLAGFIDWKESHGLYK